MKAAPSHMIPNSWGSTRKHKVQSFCFYITRQEFEYKFPLVVKCRRKQNNDLHNKQTSKSAKQLQFF